MKIQNAKKGEKKGHAMERNEGRKRALRERGDPSSEAERFALQEIKEVSCSLERRRRISSSFPRNPFSWAGTSHAQKNSWK